MRNTLRRAVRLRTLAGLFFCTLLSLSSVAQAPPSQDTFVSSATPKINFGPSIALIVSPGSTSYIQFNLSGVPAGAIVSKATLRLYVDAVASKGSFDVYQLNSAWSENTLTYNTPPPALGASATGGHPVSVTTASNNQFLLIDVTSLAQGWVNGTIPNSGVALALTTATGTFSFDSKESLLTGNGPELELAFVSPGPQGPAGAQGIPGPPGPQGIQGPAGLTGPPGIDGAIGPKGTTGQGFTFKGAFDPAAAYSPYDVVTFNGSSYVAKATVNAGDAAPDANPNWSLMAQQGTTGPQGPKGDPGPQGIQGIQGIQGLPGPAGPQGLTGSQGQGGISHFAGYSWDEPSYQDVSGANLFTVPDGVTAIQIEAVGGGGGAGGGQGNSGPFFSVGGGASGGYSRVVLTVLPGTIYKVVVGRPGENGDFLGPHSSLAGENGFNSSVLDPTGFAVACAPGGGGAGATVDPPWPIQTPGGQQGGAVSRPCHCGIGSNPSCGSPQQFLDIRGLPGQNASRIAVGNSVSSASGMGGSPVMLGAGAGGSQTFVPLLDPTAVPIPIDTPGGSGRVIISW